MELTNRIYVFSPDSEKGFMFYDQSLSDDVSKFSGTLPSGKYLSSGEKIVEWDEEINGPKINDISVNSHLSLLTNSQRVRVHDGDSYFCSTIIVSNDNFLKLLQQLEKPVMENQQYKILDFNSVIYEYTYYKSLNNFDSKIK